MSAEQRSERWVERMAATAAALDYPPTPDLAARLRAASMASAVAASQRRERAAATRRLALALAAVVLLCLFALAVPPVRATVLSFLRLGAVQITLEPTAIPTPPTPPTPSTLPTPPPSPTTTPRPLSSLLDLSGQTTLAQARAELKFPLRLPSYPSGLGEPDAAFVQDLGDQTVMLVWMDPGQPRRVRLALQILGPEAFVEKVRPRVVQVTSVNGQRALWAVGEYMLRSRRGDPEIRRLITGNTLIWEDGGITYRLETDLPMAEAVKIAESLR